VTKKTSSKDGAASEEATLDQTIADALIADIIEWRIGPGTWIRERTIAERFNVSHAPVREAFRQLSLTGLVEVVPWRGARVNELDPAKIEAVYELWKSLFGSVCKLTAERFDPSNAPELLQLLGHYETTVSSSNDTMEHLKASLFVGDFISRRCGSQLAYDTLLRVARLARWHHPLIKNPAFERMQPGLGIVSAQLYRRLVEAVIARTSERAEAAARDLIAYTQSFVQEAARARAGQSRENVKD
jgi:DNA-binding GntR family transcriptional regulator